MCAASAGGDAYSCKTITDDLAESLSANRSDGRVRREEEAAPEAGRTGFPYVAQNGIADVRRQRPDMGPARLRAANPNDLVLPVQIVEPQPGDFPGPQPVGDKQHEDRAVALVDWAIPLNRGQQTQDILDEHLGGPPLLITRTEGATPFRLTTHVGDVGHALIVGPTGAGKSVLLATLILQFRKYADAQIYVFDKGRSVRAAMLGLGGQFHDLGLEGGLTFQPLRDVHDPAARAWAAEWIQ